MMMIIVTKDSCVGDSGSGLMREIQIPGDYFPRLEKIPILVGKLNRGNLLKQGGCEYRPWYNI